MSCPNPRFSSLSLSSPTYVVCCYVVEQSELVCAPLSLPHFYFSFPRSSGVVVPLLCRGLGFTVLAEVDQVSSCRERQRGGRHPHSSGGVAVRCERGVVSQDYSSSFVRGVFAKLCRVCEVVQGLVRFATVSRNRGLGMLFRVQGGQVLFVSCSLWFLGNVSAWFLRRCCAFPSG